MRSSHEKATDAYNNASDAVLGVAVALQVLRDGNKDAGWERHVKYSVGLLPALLKLLNVFPKVDKRIVLVVLARDVGAETTKLGQLLLHILCGRLDVGFDATKVLLVIHLRSSIADDFDIFGKEVVAMLNGVRSVQARGYDHPTSPKRAGNYAAVSLSRWQRQIELLQSSSLLNLQRRPAPL